MTMEEIAISMPGAVLKRARSQVRAGRADSLSALVSAAVDEKLRSDELLEILDEMDVRHGPPIEEAKAWARRLVR